MSTTTTATVASPRPIEDLNGDGHVRVLLLGDSLLENAIPSFDEVFAEAGVEVRYLGYPGTGLLTQFPEDDGATWWSRILRDGLADFAPDAVIIESCCNYDGSYVGPDGVRLVADSEAMYERWEQEASALTDTVASAGVPVYWVVTPSPAPGAELDFPPSRIDRLNEIYASLGVPLIDWEAALDAAEQSCGRDLHCSDGLHLDNDGSAVVAKATARALTTPGT